MATREPCPGTAVRAAQFDAGSRCVNACCRRPQTGHHIKFLKHALNLAIDWDLLIEKNPASRVPLFNVDNRIEHFLNDAQLERLLTVLRTDKNRNACLVVMFLLSTGARLNEALKATWDQIDQQTRVWKIPASNSKSKRIRSVPLNDSALEVLAQLETKGSCSHVSAVEQENPLALFIKFGVVFADLQT